MAYIFKCHFIHFLLAKYKGSGVVEITLDVSDASLSLNELNGQQRPSEIGEYPAVQPIMQKDGELSYEFLVIEAPRGQGVPSTGKICTRDTLKEHLKASNQDITSSMRKIDSLRDKEELAVLRRDNDFAEEMDKLGLPREQTLPVHTVFDHVCLLDMGLVIDGDHRVLNASGEQIDVTVHTVRHPSLNKIVYLMNKNELFLVLDNEKKSKKDIDVHENKRTIFVGTGDVYLLDGLELDVELDFFPSEYEEMEQLESYIEEQNISPVQSENGYIEVPKDVVVYVADEGKVDYAVAFESPPMQKTVKQNMELEM